MEYGAPIWLPIISDSNWSRLQTVQNQALRTATGCLAMSSIPHLHRDCKMLPVKEHWCPSDKAIQRGMLPE